MSSTSARMSCCDAPSLVQNTRLHPRLYEFLSSALEGGTLAKRSDAFLSSLKVFRAAHRRPSMREASKGGIRAIDPLSEVVAYSDANRNPPRYPEFHLDNIAHDFSPDGLLGTTRTRKCSKGLRAIQGPPPSDWTSFRIELSFSSLPLTSPPPTPEAGPDLGIELATPNASAVCAVEREAWRSAELSVAMEASSRLQRAFWSDGGTFNAAHGVAQ